MEESIKEDIKRIDTKVDRNHKNIKKSLKKERKARKREQHKQREEYIVSSLHYFDMLDENDKKISSCVKREYLNFKDDESESKFKKVLGPLWQWFKKHKKVLIGLKLVGLTLGLYLYFIKGWSVDEIVSLFWILIQYISFGFF